MLKNTRRFFFIISLICFVSSYTMATQAIILDNEEGPQDNGSSFIINSNKFFDDCIAKEVEVQKEGRYFLISPTGFFSKDCSYTAWWDEFSGVWQHDTSSSMPFIDEESKLENVFYDITILSIKEIFKN